MEKYRKVLWCGLAAFAIGFIAWAYQGVVGLGVTNLSNAFVWGNYVACFEFFIGVAVGGLLVFSLAYLIKKHYLRALAPIAAATALAGAGAAILSILSDMGMALRLYRVLLTPNFMSPMVWDIGIMAVFLVVSALAVFFQLKKSEYHCRKLAYVGLPVTLLMGLVTAMLFATQRSHEWWNSALFPVDSLVATFALGSSVVLLFSLLYFGQKRMLENDKAYTLLGKLVVICLAAHIVMTLLELVPFIGSQAPANQQLLALLFGRYGGLYVLEFLVSVGAIVIYWLKRYAAQFKFNFLACLLVVIGGFIHRIMVLAPAFNTHELTLDVAGELWSPPVAVGTFVEGSSSFVTYWGYFPSAIEWLLLLMPVGATLILMGILFAKIHERGSHKVL